MKLTGYIVCPKIYLLVYVTWDDYVTSRDNYNVKTAAILDPPSWIGFWKILKTNKNVLKTRKKVKIIALKLFFINRNTKITNLGKHACQNAVAMVTSSS